MQLLLVFVFNKQKGPTRRSKTVGPKQVWAILIWGGRGEGGKPVNSSERWINFISDPAVFKYVSQAAHKKITTTKAIDGSIWSLEINCAMVTNSQSEPGVSYPGLRWEGLRREGGAWEVPLTEENWRAHGLFCLSLMHREQAKRRVWWSSQCLSFLRALSHFSDHWKSARNEEVKKWLKNKRRDAEE